MKEKNKRLTAILAGWLIFSHLFSSNIYCADIAIYGDSQHDKVATRRIVRDIVRFRPAAVFRIGDMVNDGLDVGQWDSFNAINKPLISEGKFYPALGNHEKDSPLYFKNFPFLENRRWYSVDCEGIHFIVLDSNSSLKAGSAQYKWLTSDLENAKGRARFTVVIFHHTLFSVGMHPEDEKSLRPVLLPLFEKYGVSAVFSGHDHDYERFYYKGIFFVVTGGGGSHLRDRTRESPYLVKYKKAYHFCILSPEKDFIRVRVVDINVKLIDEFKIRQSEKWVLER